LKKNHACLLVEKHTLEKKHALKLIIVIRWTNLKRKTRL
jgi:hypothetical protein